jgi:hypothetical protein
VPADVLRGLADHLVEHGGMTREDADRALREGHGVEPGTVAPVDPDEEPGEVAMAEALEHGARPEEYRLPRLMEPGAQLTPEVVAFDKQAREWLAEAGLPREIGTFVATEVAKVAEATKDATEAQCTAYRMEQEGQLRRMWGSDFDRKVALARQLVAQVEAKRPGIVEYLEATRAGDCAAVVAQLALAAERLTARNKRKG